MTDAVAILNGDGKRVAAVTVPMADCMGVNDRVQLAAAERRCAAASMKNLMRGGVTMIDPERTYIEAGVTIGEDTVIYPGCTLQGNTCIGARCTILPNCRMKDAAVGDETTVESSVLIECTVGSGTTVGPNAYLRPKAHVGDHCRIGDFGD